MLLPFAGVLDAESTIGRLSCAPTVAAAPECCELSRPLQLQARGGLPIDGLRTAVASLRGEGGGTLSDSRGTAAAVLDQPVLLPSSLPEESAATVVLDDRVLPGLPALPRFPCRPGVGKEATRLVCK